jgi:two-component system sensor histidine kinase DegS
VDFEAGTIDKVLKSTLEVMDNSKYQIFEICESARSEHFALNKEHQQVMVDITAIIEKVDKCEKDFKNARIRLTEVSRDFKRFNEDHIRSAYETATQFQMEIMILREKEANLRARRDDLQQRVRNVERTIERAETIVSQMNVVLEYLSGDVTQITRILESAKNRQLLGLKIILAQEEERKRIAREIHDGLAQSMANLVLRTEIAEKMLVKQQYDTVKAEVLDLKAQVRSGLEEVRKIIFNLRPMTLDDLGLVPTLRKYVQDFEDKHSVRTKFNLIGKEARLPSAMEVAIYRFSQEAFSNVLKHANASYISLEITYQKQMIKIVVQDNGKGFSVDTMEAQLGDHFGIIGMQERVELLEGRFDIESKKDAGTKVTMIVPIKAEKKEGEWDDE